MPTDTSQQIAALESRLATLEEAIGLIAKDLGRAKERESKRNETLCPRFREDFNDSSEGAFENRSNKDALAGTMDIAIPNGARLTSISSTGSVLRADTGTTIELGMSLRKESVADGTSRQAAKIVDTQTGAGGFTARAVGLNEVIDNSAYRYSLHLYAFWKYPHPSEHVGPIVRFHVIEVAYEIPQV